MNFGEIGSITLDCSDPPLAVAFDEDATYHFVKYGKIVTDSKMRALGYDLQKPNPRRSFGGAK